MQQRFGRIAGIALVTLAFNVANASAQSVQYTTTAGVIYRSVPDTGAIARAEQALAAEPNNVEHIIALGIAQSGARQFREAIQTFTRGLRIDPKNAVLYRWRGHRFLSVRDYDRALADLNQGALIDSSVYGIWYHLGVLRYIRGEFAAAADAFKRGLPLAPNAAERAGSYDWQWMSLMRAGREDEARALLKSMPDSVPVAAANAYSQRLRLYQGRIGPGDVFTKADTGDVAVATLSYGIGNWYLLHKETKRAKEWFERSIQSGGWPAFGFMASEAELKRMK
ncbi:MAG: tetratricopeptide repeat protein [Gemmatimonadaceae bacterium]